MIIVSNAWKVRLVGILGGGLLCVVGINNLLLMFFAENKLVVCYMSAGVIVVGVALCIMGLVIGGRVE